jgi:glycosyltransferase involved in cell wall biosynthesis
MSSPAVSVVMPCFNAAPHVLRGIGSALAQSLRDIELIVVDDGSTDETATMVKGVDDPRVHLIQQVNRGVSAARNQGIEAARGEFLAFLDADDTWTADCLEKLRGALVANPRAVLAYCGWQNLGLPDGRDQPYVPPDYETADKLAQLLPECPWPIHAALTRTAAIRSAGGFDDRFAYAEDFGLWLRVACFAPIVRVPQVLAIYHHHNVAPRASDDVVRAARQLRQVQWDFVAGYPEVERLLGRAALRRIIEGGILNRAYSSYWRRDLPEARAIFRLLMRQGYGGVRDWVYMLPALLPLPLHRKLLQLAERRDAGRG